MLCFFLDFNFLRDDTELGFAIPDCLWVHTGFDSPCRANILWSLSCFAPITLEEFLSDLLSCKSGSPLEPCPPNILKMIASIANPFFE